ncbi:unnamed protein product [Prunus armeniaca]|uniref:Uncharacterized protein n=1 Tax=Prunus armeniaca TaxID=36596 RepID=A0A6J5Y0L4_PRUAR|nr:unnamed protein product [Prunus armeniaca]
MSFLRQGRDLLHLVPRQGRFLVLLGFERSLPFGNHWSRDLGKRLELGPPYFGDLGSIDRFRKGVQAFGRGAVRASSRAGLGSGG